MEPDNYVRISPFSLIQRILCKITKRKLTAVTNLLAMSFSQPFYNPIVSRCFEESESGRVFHGDKPIFTTSGLEGYRETLFKPGISKGSHPLNR